MWLWHMIASDPYLYREVHLEGLEMHNLVLQLRRLGNIATRVRSISLDSCFSQFIQSTVIPVTFASSSPHLPTLYAHITTLQRVRRKQEYERCAPPFDGKQSGDFAGNSIQNCNLDLEMTELAFGIIRYGSKLEALTYFDNRDNTFNSAELLTGVIAACPNMRRFKGYHLGIDERVILNVAKYWKNLESFTLSCTSRETAAGHPNLNSPSQATNLTSQGLKPEVLWKLLTSCTSLEELELVDMACVNNDTLAQFVKKIRQDSDPSNHGDVRFQPYKVLHRSRHGKLGDTQRRYPGNCLKSLRIVKYTTSPLTMPGFESILALFPNLRTLQYDTNYMTFDNLYDGLTPQVFEFERQAIERLFDDCGTVTYHGRWHMPITTEQRLMAGISSLSN
ncbi:unnamed protein product [Umbelopsis vinacea]